MVITRANLAPTRPPLEHPYSALALVLGLSGSQKWTTVAVGEKQRHQEGPGKGFPALDLEGSVGPREGLEEEELAGLGGDSSRLWSTDSEDDEVEGDGEGVGEGEGQKGQPSEALLGRRLLRSAEQGRGGGDEAGTQEWLEAFEDDAASESERSARTDGE